MSELEDYLKGNGSSIINQFQKYLISHSNISPIAGNPGSLQANMVDSSFARGSMNTGANASTATSGSQFGISVSAGEFSVKGYSGTSYSLPISYTYHFDNPAWAILLNLPIGYQEVGNAKSYSAQIGLGLQIPVIKGVDWYITPTVSEGATGSMDLGAAGILNSYALNSRYTYHQSSNLDITLGNMIGLVDSMKVKIGSYSIDPGINNTILKNGVSAEYKTNWSFWDQPQSIRAGFAYTNAFGSKLAIDNYGEIYVDYGTLTTVNAPFYKRIRVGATYTFGSNYQAASLNFGYQF